MFILRHRTLFGLLADRLFVRARGHLARASGAQLIYFFFQILKSGRQLQDEVVPRVCRRGLGSEAAG